MRPYCLTVSESCAVSGNESFSSAAETDALPVNGSHDDDNDKLLSHHHHVTDDADTEPWQSAGDTVGSDVTVSTNDVTLTVTDNSADINGTSTLSAGDCNDASTSTTSAGDSISSDGSFNGFIVAMHRKMVSRHIPLHRHSEINLYSYYVVHFVSNLHRITLNFSEYLVCSVYLMFFFVLVYFSFTMYLAIWLQPCLINSVCVCVYGPHLTICLCCGSPAACLLLYFSFQAADPKLEQFAVIC